MGMAKRLSGRYGTDGSRIDPEGRVALDQLRVWAGAGRDPEADPGAVVFWSGRHAGRSVAEVARTHPSYLVWWAASGRPQFAVTRAVAAYLAIRAVAEPVAVADDAAGPGWLAEAQALAPVPADPRFRDPPGRSAAAAGSVPPWEEGSFPDPLPPWCGTVEVGGLETRQAGHRARLVLGTPPRRTIPEERERATIPPPSGRTVQHKLFD